MATRTFPAGMSLAMGLAVSLLTQQATATEELVVYGTPASAAVKIDQEAFRAEIANYVRTLNEQLKETLDADLKRALAPKLELASAEIHARG